MEQKNIYTQCRKKRVGYILGLAYGNPKKKYALDNQLLELLNKIK